MGWFSKDVELTLIDDATGAAFAQTSISPDNLPESFDLHTTLHIGNDDWSVIEASHAMRAEYAKSKKLTLRVRKIERIDPSQILFSLPTICDFIPAAEGPAVGDGDLSVREDEWRNFEFVASSLSSIVDEEITAILRIHQEFGTPSGWREIHVRKRPERPLIREELLDDLMLALGADAPKGVFYRGARNGVTDGYSVRLTDGLTVYGTAPAGIVDCIAIDKYSDGPRGAETIESLKIFARDRRLELVDWCRCARIEPDDEQFEALFR